MPDIDDGLWPITRKELAEALWRISVSIAAVNRSIELLLVALGKLDKAERGVRHG